MAMHPTALPGEAIFAHAWHRLHRWATRLAKPAVWWLITDVDHRLRGGGMVTVCARGGPPGQASLPLQCALQRLVIGCPLQAHGRDHPAPRARFSPPAVGFRSPLAHVRARPQPPGPGRDHAPRPMPMPPPVTVALAPRRRVSHATPSRWDDPGHWVLGRPDRSQRLVHQLISADHVT